MDSRSVIPPPPLGGVFGLPSAAPLSPPPPSRRGGLPRRSRCSDLGVHDAEIRVHDAPIFAFTIGRSGRSRWTETRKFIAARDRLGMKLAPPPSSAAPAR